MNPYVRLTVRMPVSLVESLKRSAAENQISFNDYVLQVLNQELDLLDPMPSEAATQSPGLKSAGEKKLAP
jgi:hypothetical protein